MRNQQAPVSVVIPCFRNADTLVRAVDSARGQYWPPSEIIIVDDASDDPATKKILTEFELLQDGLVRIIRLDENSGPSVARNTGWDSATQPYVAFLDADDAWHPSKIELQLPEMLRDASIAMSAHIYGDFAQNSEPISPVPAYDLRLNRMLIGNRVSTPTVILRADLPERFDASVRFSEDYDLWLRILAAGNRCIFLPQILARGFKKPFGDSGLSGNLRAMEKGQVGVYRRLWRAGVINSPAYAALRIWSNARYWRRLVISRSAKRR